MQMLVILWLRVWQKTNCVRFLYPIYRRYPKLARRDRHDVDLVLTDFDGSLWETMRLMQTTDLLLGMHGAGFTNAMFLPKVRTATWQLETSKRRTGKSTTMKLRDSCSDRKHCSLPTLLSSPRVDPGKLVLRFSGHKAETPSLKLLYLSWRDVRSSKCCPCTAYRREGWICAGLGQALHSVLLAQRLTYVSRYYG